TVTDADGSTGTTSFTVVIDDDTPVAVNDGVLASHAENVSGLTIGTVAGILGNDHYGADGPAASGALVIGAGDHGGTVAIVAGNLVYTNTTLNVANGATVDETFTYTIKDGDGDITTATFKVTLTDTGVTAVAASANLIADEDDIVGAGGNPGGLGDDAPVLAGHISYTLGADQIGSVALSTAGNATGLQTLAGAAVDTTWVGGQLIGYVHGTDPNLAANQVFTIAVTGVNNSGADYAMTLLQPVQHTVGGTEDNTAPFTVTATVTDADGSTGTTSFTVVIDDDTPVALPDTVLGTVTGTVLINVIANDAFGADGVNLTTSVNVATAPTHGTLINNHDGTFSYTPTAGYNGGDSFTYTIIDRDGDASTAAVTIPTIVTNSPPVVLDSHNWMSSDPAQETATGHPDGYPLLVNIPTDPDGNNITVTASSVPTGVYYFDGAYHAVTAGMTLFQTGGINLLDDLVYRPTVTANDTVNLNLSLNVSDGFVTVTENVGIHEVAPSRLPTDTSQIGDGSSPLTSGNDQTQTLTLSQSTINGITNDPHGSALVIYTDFQKSPFAVPIPGDERNPGAYSDTNSAGTQREQEVQVEIVIGGNHFVVVEADTTAAKFEQSWFYDDPATGGTGLMKATVNYDQILLNGNGISLADYLVAHPPTTNDTWTLLYTDNDGGSYQARTVSFNFFTHDPGDPGITVTGDATLPDQIYGTSGHDVLSGGGGNDIIYGGGGGDIIIGGTGQDELHGGTGADTFKLDNLNIKDLIADYSGAGGEGDKIDLTALFDTAPGDNIANFVKYDSTSHTLSVDANGAAGGANFVDVAVLQNAPAAGTINLLYDDTAHVQHPITI
ncbi:type I secretion C-terminal target domain-containing protein, partial [Mesorhizobium sp. B2-3-11]|uniref:Ig-like domain-containing protein n=1 Tax=Mesorhizobium sp. B2-3-11 TaxID=2589953 RepID=UPI00112B66A9